MRALLPLTSGLILLAGCAAQDCDPRAAGFLSGIGCASSGAYAQRTAYQQQALGAASAQALEARSDAIEQGDRAANSRAAANAAARRLRQVDSSIANLRARLSAAQQREGVDQARLAEARVELARLEQDRAAVSRAPTEAQLQDMQRRNQALGNMVKMME